ncbi:phosphogluconate dehydratase [Marinomonas communis]|uniref:Phosphogluconate dehydratase n=1 Tax=Marinomonas communis TaxID=28254 RepID=A0A4R6X6X2_9GAMM|nr:phosphogluconate dehydratase [Marinomonas communis]MCC4275697.1 phosphogluconate dehydratase [Marinomonas communis]MEC8081823.1 phosphogluconate dehydratase [Pseudomonadota bacterium]MEC8484771.1 phosphogluconate dehydratase [Pseudomonadota bacterium]TDR12707.1 6-phosphogluconate dehydratase [Marinomonas communis]
MNPIVEKVTQAIIERSKPLRSQYLADMQQAELKGPHRGSLSCGNLAHGFAACQPQEKQKLKLMDEANIGIVTSYNDMLSAHKPYETYPDIIRSAVAEMGSVAQVAGAVPAMCDGVTQGQEGMELSLFSRDNIAQGAAIALSHNMFDAALFLGICDKIVPGLLIAALRFGHLPCLFVPAGPMPSGITNAQKAAVRQRFAKGEASRDELLEAESASYHSAGTCTFYGTANSNQLLVEMMGLQLPGSSFVNPDSPMRDALTRYTAQLATKTTALGKDYRPIYKVIDERSIVNAMVGLLATGGSTNHTMHIVAFARAAGIVINWQDFSELSKVVPLLTRIYPNGQADINHFQAAGGMAFLTKQLLKGGLVHEDVNTIVGHGLTHYTKEPFMEGDQLVWRDGVEASLDDEVVRSIDNPFSKEGGLSLLEGNLGRAVIKVSAVKEENRVIEAPAAVFHDQNDLAEAIRTGELKRDCVAVVRYQGPKAIGMPELHKLTPFLGNLQDQGYKVALVTDGRMSGASGKVPAAIHLTPEALAGGLIGKIQDGDLVRLDANKGTLSVLVSDAELAKREQASCDLTASHQGMGREMFAGYRMLVNGAEQGACSLFPE